MYSYKHYKALIIFMIIALYRCISRPTKIPIVSDDLYVPLSCLH